jgi:phosphodiesterase/alkaline phosphatase D-like protein
MFLKKLFTFCFSMVWFYAFSQSEVKYFWSGALTSSSVKVNAKISNQSNQVRLVVDEDSTFFSPLFSAYYNVDSTTNLMLAAQIENLDSQTKYFYAIELDGILDTSSQDIGTFTTFADGPFSFSFSIGSCALESDHKVFEAMKSLNPNFYLNMGDLHYGNPNSESDVNIHRLPYENLVLSKPKLESFLKKTPIVYVWDDHDFCGDNSNGNYGGKLNARRAYSEYVPHYPLAFGSGSQHPIAQSFTVGRLHFIITDLRSERSKTQIMSEEQLSWFKNECIYARDNNLIIAWMSTYSWAGTNIDNWSGYASARTHINDFLFCNHIRNLFILSGDAHMLGIDDGYNCNFSNNNCGFYFYPNFQAGALNAVGSYKGGVYNQGGYFLNPNQTYGQFGMVDVLDQGGDSIFISFKGYRVDSSGTELNIMNAYRFARYLAEPMLQTEFSAEDVSIQPNPSFDLSVFFKKKVNLKSLKVFSISGDLVFQSTPNDLIFNFSIPIIEIESGNYIIKIETNLGEVQKIWVKE